MKKLSHWAAVHPIKARWLIGVSQITLILLAFFSACLLFLFDAKSSEGLLVLFTVIFCLALTFYPKGSALQGRLKYLYIQQKIHDLTLLLSCFLVLTFGVLAGLNNNDQSVGYSQARVQLINYTQGLDYTKQLKRSSRTGKWKQIKQFRKNLKQELKQLKKTFKQQETKQREGLKVLLTLLTIAVVIGLGLFVAALSCSVSCNGMGGLAVVILVIGWGGLIWLGIWTIKKIMNKDWSKPVPSSNT